MPNISPGPRHCGGHASGYLTLPLIHPTEVGKTVSGMVCFDRAGDSCHLSRSIQITKCSDYYVYYLKDVGRGYHDRYCGTFLF